MRTLLLLRGAMGSGKSTFIKENNLEPYVLEADRFRTLVCNPVMTEDSFAISQKNDSEAWDMLFNCLEKRMDRGDFTVIDATHTTRRLTKKYEALADMYKYSIFYYQIDATLEECLERNRNRPKFKIVPDDAIKRAHALVNSTELPSRYKKINKLSDIMNFYTEKLDGKYNKIRIFGDIHSCATVLKEALGDIQDDTLYIFLGDYFERGIEHRETFNTLMNLMNRQNVILVEGNHERWIRNYAFDSGKVTNKALEAFNAIEMNEDELKSSLRKLYKRMRQAYAFEFNGEKYLCNHGGVAFVPDMTLVGVDEFIRGYGRYETPIDKIYEENYKKGMCQGFKQIHGHRYTESTEHSICLEGDVEHGGVLKVYEIDKNGEKLVEYKNNVFTPPVEKETVGVSHGRKGDKEEAIETKDEDVNRIMRSPLVNVKKCEPNLYSINFKDKVFYDKIWNSETIKARGLFVDRETGDVKLRSYNKFFNLYENEYSSLEKISRLKYPLEIYEKMNGYLGILSVIDGELVFASKSNTTGDYAKLFKEVFETVVKEETRQQLLDVLQRENASATFEVITPKDPHIVDYGDRVELHLLDFIPNKLALNGENKDVEFSRRLKDEFNGYTGFYISYPIGLLESFEAFKEYIQEHKKDTGREGFVFVDNEGYMVKYKIPWYNTWKRRRWLLFSYLKTPSNKFDFSKCRSGTDVEFMKYVTDENLDKILDAGSIVKVRRLFYEYRDSGKDTE